MSTNEHVHPNPIPTSNNHETLIHTSQPATIEAPIGSSPLPTSTTNEIHSLNIEQQKTIESKQQEIKQKEQILAIKREEEITEQQQQPNQQSSHTTTITNTNEQTKTENMSESSSQQPKQIKQENQTTINGSLTNKNDENNNNNTATVRKILAPANPQVANGVSGSSGSVASKSVTPPRNPIVLNSGTPQSSSSSSSKPKIMSPLDIKMQNYKNRQLMMGGGGGNGVVLPTTMTTIVTNNNANNSNNTGSSHPLEPVESHSHNKQSSSSSSSASLLPRPRSDSHNRSSPNRHHSHHSSRSSSGRNDFSHNSGNFNQRKPDPRDHFGHFTRSAQDYYFYEKLGEGTYGEVFKARCKRTNEIVALKKIRMDREEQGFPITAIREIIILKSLDHENIVRLREVIAAIDQPIFYMVFDYVEHDLAGLLDARVPFTEGQVKSLVKQLLSALRECHRRKILHRDLKASNLLITQQGVLKLADFGLSRFMQQGKNRYTNRVITRWYRPPELLLGSTEYTSKIDMWSVGCILGEMILGSKTMFPGRTELEQLELIWKICGTPTMESWAAVSNQPLWKECKPKRESKRVLKEKFSQTLFSKEAIDLLDKLLVLDPEKRLSAEECLQHEWFKKGPEPERPFNLPSRTCNEYGARKRKERGGVGPDMPPPLSHNPNIGHHGIPSEPYYSDIHPSKKMRYTNAHGTNFRQHPPRSGHMDGGGRPQIGGPPGASGSFIPPSGTSGDHHGHHPQQQHGSRFHHGSGPHGSSGGGHGTFYNGPRGSSRQPYHTRDGHPPSFKGGNPKHGPATNGPDNNSGNTGSTEPQQHHHSQQHHSSRDGGDGNRPSYSHNKGDRQSYHHHNRSNYSGGPRRYQGGGGGGEYHHRGSGGSNRDNYSNSRSGGGDYHHHHSNRSFDPSTHHRDHPPQHGSSAHHHHGSSANGSGGGSSDGGANGYSHHPSRHSGAQDSSGRPPSSSSKRRDEHHSSHHGSSGGSKEGHQPPQSSTN